MAEQFSREVANLAITATNNVESSGPVTAPQSPPFNTCKAVGRAWCMFTPGAAATAVAIRIYRNPSGENAVVAQLTGIPVTPATQLMLEVDFADRIQDGRSVQYGVTLQQTSATGNGTTNGAAYIDAALLSG